jgi:hypothetical protein
LIPLFSNSILDLFFGSKNLNFHLNWSAVVTLFLHFGDVMNTPTTYKLVLEGPNGREFLLNQPELLVGRDPTAQIVIPTPAISRNHARLRWTEAGYTLEDLDSSNGSFVNEQRLPANQPFLLQPDQAVRFGQAVRLRYVVLNPSASIGGLSDATVSESLASNPTELEPFGAAPTPSAGGTLVVPEPPSCSARQAVGAAVDLANWPASLANLRPNSNQYPCWA